jgi:hypothetical protein
MHRSFEQRLPTGRQWRTLKLADGRELAYFTGPAIGWRVPRYLAKLNRGN